MVTTLLKILLACSLIFWLFSSGKIDLQILIDSVNYKTGWVVCILTFMLNTLLITIRWKKILEIQSTKIFPYLSVLKMTWIGNLFNTVLPGVVSGDFIKLFYVKKYDPSLTKTFLVTSVFMDRILGLTSLLTILGFSSLFNYQRLMALSPEIKHLMHLNFFILFGMILFLLTLFIPANLQKKILPLFSQIPFLGKMVSNTFTQFWSIGKNRLKVFYLILLGMFTQSLNMAAFWFLMKPYIQYLSPDLPPLVVTDAFSFIPLGFVAVAIPITPSGLGVGHAAFDTLFRYFGVGNGASLFNFQFITNVLVNLMGVFPYLLNKTKQSSQDLKEFAEFKKI